MAHRCEDCGKALATRGGLDVHRAQWCRGEPEVGALTSPSVGGESRRFGRRKVKKKLRLVQAPGEEAMRPLALTAPMAETERAADPDEDSELPAALHAFVDLRGEDEQVELPMVMWLMRQRVCSDRVPSAMTVVRFDFTGSREQTFWLVIEPAEVTLFVNDPGLLEDVVVVADVLAFHQVFMGRMLFAEALAADQITLDGPEPLVCSLPRWFEWSGPVRRDASGGILSH